VHDALGVDGPQRGEDPEADRCRLGGAQRPFLLDHVMQ
jgi:hypothetical protein